MSRLHHQLFSLFTLANLFLWTAVVSAEEPVPDTPYERLTPKFFDVHFAEMDDEGVPVAEPWKTIVLDPEYRGSWIVTGDLTGDGRREIVCARSMGGGSERYTSAVAAHDLDGNVLWRWGDPTIGTGVSSHDVACQIHDWNQDGNNEVIVAGKGKLIVLDGKSGEVIHQFDIPRNSSDCLVFCDLQGHGYPADVLVKSRYEQIWAFGPDGRLLWTSEKPGGYLTAHQPRPMDITGDGRHEIMAGYALLNPDGTQRWVLDETVPYNNPSGHLDCARIIRRGDSPDETRMIVTFCGGNRLAKVDGNGRFYWRVAGVHFESVNIGNIMPDVPGKQILVDVDHRPWGESPLTIFSEDGELLGRFMLEGSRHHLLVDWTGDGVDSIVVAKSAAMFNGRGEKTVRFALPTPEGEEPADRRKLRCQTAEMTGNGVPDLLLADNPGTRVYIYENTTGSKVPPPPTTGSNNFTFY